MNVDTQNINDVGQVSENLEFWNFQSDGKTVEITRYNFNDFIGNEAAKYYRKFSKFHSDGRDKFSFTWHWPAFFLTAIWMAYRKLYGWAVVAFLLSLVPFFNFFLWPVLGLTGNYLYYKHTKKKILELKATTTISDPVEMTAALRKIGGVNGGAALLVVALSIALYFVQRHFIPSPFSQ